MSNFVIWTCREKIATLQRLMLSYVSQSGIQSLTHSLSLGPCWRQHEGWPTMCSFSQLCHHGTFSALYPWGFRPPGFHIRIIRILINAAKHTNLSMYKWYRKGKEKKIIRYVQTFLVSLEKNHFRVCCFFYCIIYKINNNVSAPTEVRWREKI